MPFRVITPATDEPLTVDDARLHIRLGDDETAEDALIQRGITTAREVAEGYSGRILVSQELEAAFDSFPGCWEVLVLPFAPVTSVVSIKYTDTAGTEQTLDPATYALSPYGSAREVYLKTGKAWPMTARERDAVRVRVIAGYAEDQAPSAAISAMLLIIAHLFENRQENVVDSRAAAIQLPLGAQALLDTIKVYG